MKNHHCHSKWRSFTLKLLHIPFEIYPSPRIIDIPKNLTINKSIEWIIFFVHFRERFVFQSLLFYCLEEIQCLQFTWMICDALSAIWNVICCAESYCVINSHGKILCIWEWTNFFEKMASLLASKTKNNQAKKNTAEKQFTNKNYNSITIFGQYECYISIWDVEMTNSNIHLQKYFFFFSFYRTFIINFD